MQTLLNINGPHSAEEIRRALTEKVFKSYEENTTTTQLEREANKRSKFPHVLGLQGL